MKQLSLLLPLTLILLSCEKNIGFIINYSDFTEINDAALYSTLSPAIDYDYFEIRESDCGPDDYYQVLYACGNKCPDIPDTASCVEQWDSVYSEEGFHYACLPACCMNYIVSKRNNEIEIYSDTEGVISFLEPVDTPSDAMMIAYSQGYYFVTGNVRASGYRRVDDTFQLIALKLVEFCTPVQTNKYLLEVHEDGTLEVLEEDVYDKMNGACI